MRNFKALALSLTFVALGITLVTVVVTVTLRQTAELRLQMYRDYIGSSAELREANTAPVQDQIVLTENAGSARGVGETIFEPAGADGDIVAGLSLTLLARNMLVMLACLVGIGAVWVVGTRQLFRQFS